LHFLDSVKTPCDECEGKRYNSEVLALKYRDKNIADILDMTARQAYEFFTTDNIRKRLRLLIDTGLGYLKLGQSLSTLSGGESQRLKIAAELTKSTISTLWTNLPQDCTCRTSTLFTGLSNRW
jgi:excinuclease ABC subunit A